MAIDSARERRSALDFEDPVAEGLPIADGTIDALDRGHILLTYYTINIKVRIDSTTSVYGGWVQGVAVTPP